MAQLLILTPQVDGEVLPALSLLSHKVRAIPAEPAQLISGQADGLGVIGDLGAPDGGHGGVGEHPCVVDPVFVEARQRRELAGHRGRGRRAPGAGLVLGGQVPDPQFDVVPLGGEGMDAEPGAPCCPRQDRQRLPAGPARLRRLAALAGPRPR